MALCDLLPRLKSGASCFGDGLLSTSERNSHLYRREFGVAPSYMDNDIAVEAEMSSARARGKCSGSHPLPLGRGLPRRKS